MGEVGKSLVKTYNRARSEKHIDILVVLETVTNYPCLNPPRIAEKLKVRPGTARWYLKKLEEKKLIESARVGGKIVYYTKGLVALEDVKDITFLQHHDVHTLLVKIANTHGCSKKGILDELPMEKISKAYSYIQHLEKLVDMGFVRVLKDRKMNYYYLTDKLFRLYKKYADIEEKIGSAAVRNLNAILPELQPGITASLKEVSLRDGNMMILINSAPTRTIQKEYKLRLNPLWSYQEVIQRE